MSSCRPELKAADGVLRLSLLATITLYDRQFTIAVGNDIDQCEQRIDERLCSPLQRVALMLTRACHACTTG
jgi:hypothetical protein